MDDGDRARKLQATLNESAAKHRKPVPDLEAVGYCHTCGELVDSPRLFCGPACSDVFERTGGN